MTSASKGQDVVSKKELVTKQRAKRINAAVEVRTQTPHEADSVGFAIKSLAIANLPYNDPKTDRWTRTNGNFTLEIVALRKGDKIPFGVIPRLFMLWLISEIANPIKQRQRSNKYEIVLGHYFSDFLENIGYKEDGGYTRKRVKQQMEWLFNVAMGSYYEDKVNGSTEASVPKAFVKWYKFYWDEKKGGTQQTLFPSYIILEEDFYNEVTKSPIPIDMRVVEALKNSPLKLDIYIWLTYKMFNIREPLHIDYEDLMKQFGTNFNDVKDKTGKKTNSALNNFRLKFRKALKDVIDIYPVKVNTTSPKQIVLYASPTSVPRKLTRVK